MKKEHERVSQVFDSGRRGAPRAGCDCEQCFGYCFGFLDYDAAARALNADRELRQGVPDMRGPIDAIFNPPVYGDS